MSDATDIPDSDSVLAAEYVLGLLSEDAARDVARRMVREPALRDLFDTWTEHFADLAADLDPVPAPDGIWTSVETRLFGARKPLWRRLGAGLGLGQAVLGGALAAGLALAVVQFGWLEPDSAPYTAALTTEAAENVARIELDADSGALTAELIGAFPEDGRARELWLIQGDNAPVSLGLLSPGVVVALAVPDPLRGALDGAVLAISDEPAGGSPTGLPTGAVLATGVITAT
ncbi:anti-sigma factor [Marinovum sp. 2_MG-2023]|uniref:anti-sigma factor n=1 Tax=unclassified Marinovum TaxID=2647166 RepID=UPI0026E4583C|nr:MULTISPECIES: anti-sigma factor [unclassified Marinovum]MDO6731416.1 anti-sigma factor [Marinovum sp. 2_MG-2023]MDO6780685.1 anti-sigma factor [Marinovum sp. 1_MG-2023]